MTENVEKYTIFCSLSFINYKNVAHIQKNFIFATKKY